jgi:hypothetical protein
VRFFRRQETQFSTVGIIYKVSRKEVVCCSRQNVSVDEIFYSEISLKNAVAFQFSVGQEQLIHLDTITLMLGKRWKDYT